MKALTLNCVGTEELLGKACDTMIVYAQFLGSRPVEVTGLPLHWTDATMLEGTMRNFLKCSERRHTAKNIHCNASLYSLLAGSNVNL